MATRQRRIHGDVQKAIERKALEGGWTPAQIEKWLGEQADLQSKVPTLRTIQRIVKDYERDQSVEWGLADSDPEDARLVLDVMVAVTLRSKRLWRWPITRDLAGWVIRLRRTAPEMSPAIAYYLANVYLQATEKKKSTAPLDAVLAFAPWKGEDAVKRLRLAQDKGWLPALTSWPYYHVSVGVTGDPNAWYRDVDDNELMESESHNG